MADYHEQPTTRYNQIPYQLPIPEDHIWKNEYIKIDFDNHSFEYLKNKLLHLEIPKEKIQDLIDELSIIINNAGKMNIEKPEINWLLEEFETLWDNFCIYNLKNSRWIDELNHVRRYAMYVLLQEYHKSLHGWQGDNILRYKIEQAQTYNVRQEQVESPRRRGFFSRRQDKKQMAMDNSQVQQGFNVRR